jgi:starvation-inducible DNA-binding protein
MGSDFRQAHEFLEEIYTDAQESIDAYAEQLRRIGAFPKGDFRDIVNNSMLLDSTLTLTDPLEIYAVVLADVETIISYLQDAYDEAGAVREYGLQNFLAERIDTHRKQQWMLNAIMGEQNGI